PNVFEVYFRLKHADDRSGKLLDRISNRHVRLGVLHEVDRAVVRLSLQSPLKASRGGEIRSCIRRDSASAGDLRLFHSAGIKSYGFGYRWRQKEKPFQLKPIRR